MATIAFKVKVIKSPDGTTATLAEVDGSIDATTIQEFQHVLAIDPEDLQAHYNLMLCYTGLGQEDKAKEHEKRYLRFKADEASQAITGTYRMSHPEDNNERQPIHEHTGSQR